MTPSTTKTNPAASAPESQLGPEPSPRQLEADYWREAADDAPRAYRVATIIGLAATLLGIPGEFYWFTGDELRLALWSRGLLLGYLAGLLVLILYAKPLIRRRFTWWSVISMVVIAASMGVIGALTPSAAYWYSMGVIEVEFLLALLVRIPWRVFLGGIISANTIYVAFIAFGLEEQSGALGMVSMSLTLIAVLVGFAQYMLITSGQREFVQRKALEFARQRVEERVGERTRELRELLAYIDSVREEEQARIGREIHDHLGQLLSLLRMDLSQARKQAGDADPELSARFNGIDELIREAVQATRELAATLRPRILDDLGLIPALDWLLQRVAKSTGLKVLLTAEPPEFTLDPDRSTALFRIVQEALVNVMRHAEATAVEVRLQRHDKVVELEVSDDGVGRQTPPSAEGERRRGMGLLNMSERAARFGGSVELRQGDPKGSVLHVRLPLGGPTQGEG